MILLLGSGFLVEAYGWSLAGAQVIRQFYGTDVLWSHAEGLA